MRRLHVLCSLLIACTPALALAQAAAPDAGAPDAGASPEPDVDVGEPRGTGESETPDSPTEPPTTGTSQARTRTDANDDASNDAGNDLGAPVLELPPDESAGDDPSATATIRYFFERVRVTGNDKTSRDVIARYVPLQRGDVLDVNDPSIETIRFRLIGTGWFSDVRLSLERGTRRGWVVLVVEVRERNTIVVQQVIGGLSRVVGSRAGSTDDTVEPYAGLGIAETNLLGLGSTLGVQAVVATSQYGGDLRYLDPMLLGHGFELSTRLFHNRAQEFFGKEDENIVSIGCNLPPEAIDRGEECPQPVLAKAAVVIYRRTGFSVGTGHDISGALRYTLDWQGELVNVLHKPDAASRLRGSATVPIDFRIDDGHSLVSSLQLGLIYDRRDHPGLTRRGQLFSFRAIAAPGLLGSDYDFTRLEFSLRHWQPLPWGHVVSFGLFAGSVFGRAPFFYHFYASDLSDLIPSRVLDLNLDHRAPHNLLGTSIGEMRAEELAARFDIEYALPLSSGGDEIRLFDAYVRAGIYTLANRDDVRVAIPGYDGFERLPVDLTFDIGVRADTSVGVFSVGFSTLIGFLPNL